ncbi:MAG: GAF domain-containing protein [Candidatus Eremiobacteraeota bacterium]|nr:GAF domain-containing protein [Candidatus Eremiobacteraeota bacterium]
MASTPDDAGKLREYKELELRKKVYLITEEYLNILSTLDSAAMLPEITRIIAETMDVPSCYLMVFYPDAGRLELEAYSGLGMMSFKTHSLPYGDGVEGWVAKERAPLVITDIASDHRVGRLLKTDGSKESLMAMPLILRGDFLGVVSIISEEPDKFDERMIQLFSIVCSKSAQSIKRALEFKEKDRQTREYETITKIMDFTAEVKSRDEFVRHLERAVAKMLAVSECIIELRDAPRKERERLCSMPHLDKCTAIKTMAPVIIMPHKVSCKHKKLVKMRPSVCVPLRVPEEVLGTMYLEMPSEEFMGHNREGFYRILGLHISSVLHKYLSAGRYEKRLEALASLYRVSNIMDTTAHIQDALDMIIKTVARLLEAERVQIMLLTEDESEIYVRASWSQDGKPFGVPRMKVGEGVAGWVIKHGKPYSIRDTSNDPVFIPSPDGQKELKSLLCVPLMVKNKKLGVINVGTKHRERAFSDDDIKTLVMISSRAALAIENAQLAEKIRDYISQMRDKNDLLEKNRVQLMKKGEELESANVSLSESLGQLQQANNQLSTLYEISKTIASTLDLNTILDEALRKLMKILSTPLGAIYLFLSNEEKGVFELAASRGMKKAQERFFEIRIEDIPPKVMRSLLQKKKPLFLEEQEELASLRDIGVDPRVKAMYIWPLVAKEKTMGVLTLTCGGGKLRDDELHMISALTHQISGAIENARLYQESTTRARELSSIHQIITSIISGDPVQEKLDRTVKLAAELMGQEFCCVIMVEGSTHLMLRAAHGLSHEFKMNWHSGALSGIFEKVLKGKKVFAYPTVPEEVSFLSRMQIESIIVAPLEMQEGIAGVIMLGNYRSYQYRAEEKKLLLFLADQMALGIQNITLYSNAILEKNKMQAILNSMGDGVITLNWKREITACNEAALTISGWSEEEMIGKSCPDLFHGKDHSGIDQCESNCPLIQMLRSEESMSRGIKNKGSIVTKNGEEKYIEATHSLLSVESDLTGEVIVFRDVTEEKMLQQMKSDFIASVAHDLRTPLAAIKGYAMTLIKHGGKFDKDTQKEFFMIINSEIDRLTRLLENLLNLTKMEVGKLITRSENFNVLILLKKVKDLYQMNTSKHAITIDGGQNMPYVRADIDQVEQILNNLVSNAIKYSPQGGHVALSLAVDDGFVRVCAEDEGIGIPEHELQNVFERYHRVDSSMTRRIAGTGLGLYITKILAEAQGGKVWVESTQGKGSRFFFTLPVA